MKYNDKVTQIIYFLQVIAINIFFIVQKNNAFYVKCI